MLNLDEAAHIAESRRPRGRRIVRRESGKEAITAFQALGSQTFSSFDSTKKTFKSNGLSLGEVDVRPGSVSSGKERQSRVGNISGGCEAPGDAVDAIGDGRLLEPRVGLVLHIVENLVAVLGRRNISVKGGV